MSAVPPASNWSKRLEYNWYSVEGLEKLRRLAGPPSPYEPDRFQLGCTARIMNGQDVLCVSATGDGKLALIYLASIARKGTITLVVCPTNFLESDLVRLNKNYHVNSLTFLQNHRSRVCRTKEFRHKPSMRKGCVRRV